MKDVRIKWFATDVKKGSSFAKVAENMGNYMNDDDYNIVATCSTDGKRIAGYDDKIKVLFGAWNWNVLSNKRIQNIKNNGINIVIGISNFSTNAYETKFKSYEGRLGVDTEIYKPELVSKDKFKFLTNAWDVGYGRDILLNAWKKISGDIDAELVFKLHGREDLEDIVKIIKSYDKTKVVEPCGWELDEEQMAKMINQYDCFISIAPSMGGSMISLEAMACGVPCIVSGYSVFPEYVNDDIGFILNYKLKEAPNSIIGVSNPSDNFYVRPICGVVNEEHLIENMLYAYYNRDVLEEKGKKCRKHVVENWTWEIASDRFKKILEKI